MPARRPPPPPAAERTPLASLSEGRLRHIVGYQLAQAALATTQIFEAQVGQANQLRRVEFTLLALVDANPGVTARQLAKALAVTPPNVAVMLDRLDERGLLQRERGTADARLQHLTLTTAGTTLITGTVARVQEGEAMGLSTLSAAERAMLAELLHKAGQARR
jgi:DNA-binding MarR family transcriptional regulator